MIRMEWEHNFYGNDVFRTIVSTAPVVAQQQVVVVCWCGWSALVNPGPQKPDMMKQLENLPFPPWSRFSEKWVPPIVVTFQTKPFSNEPWLLEKIFINILQFKIIYSRLSNGDVYKWSQTYLNLPPQTMPFKKCHTFALFDPRPIWEVLWPLYKFPARFQNITKFQLVGSWTTYLKTVLVNIRKQFSQVWVTSTRMFENTT